MKPWIVDADDIKQTDYDDKILYQTQSIREFLTEPTSNTIVIATKGFGKTFLIKAKRVLLHRGSDIKIFIPARSLSDKPAGDIDFDANRINFFSASRNWVTAWTLAIYFSLLKAADLVRPLTLDQPLRELAENTFLRTPYDHLASILQFSRKDFVSATEVATGQMAALVRDEVPPAALFIDNVDEYFNKHIQDLGASAASVGILSPDIWHNAQIGLLQAAYQIHRHAHQVRIFASIRKEAYLTMLRQTDAMLQQYRGSTLEVGYSASDLRSIVEANIRREPRENLVQTRGDLLFQFTGSAFIQHAYTGEQERVFDYLRRHTLNRPRDLMTIGSRLSLVSPNERRDPLTFRRAVNDSATEIADEYINEISPHLEKGVIDAVIGRLSRNVVPNAELHRIYAEFLKAEGRRDDDEENPHIFCALYKAGLLGVLRHDTTTNTSRQYFASPGERIFEPDGCLPDSAFYLVHPILEQRICARLGASADTYVERENIVGHDREWIDPPGPDDSVEEDVFVLKGDIFHFSKFMEESPDRAAQITSTLETLVKKFAKGAIVREVTGGDSVFIIHSDARKLIKIAFDIRYGLSELPEHPKLRIAIDFGPVWRRSKKRSIFSGTPVRIAARIEPVVTPGQIWITHRVEDALSEEATGFDRAQLQRDDVPHVPWESGRFNVRKEKKSGDGGATEEDIWVQLWRISF